MTTAPCDLLEFSIPEGWRVVPLWSLFTRSKVLGHVHEPMLSVFREHGVVLKDSLPNLNKTAEDRSIYQLVDRGWLVVNRMKAFQGSVGVAFQRGIVSGHYICFRPNHIQSSRYLNWLLRSDVYRTIFERLSRGVRPVQIEIDNDFLRNVPVLLPPLDVQRQIADFLDDQVGRMDVCRQKRREQIRLIGEFMESLLDQEFSLDDGKTVRASRLLRVIPGFAFSSAGFALDGVRLLRGVNLGVGHVNWDDVAYWDQGAAEAPAMEPFRLAVGDVVMGMDRPWIGAGMRIAQLTPEDVPCLLLQRVALLQPRAGLDGRYMMWAYRAPGFRRQVEVDLTGISVPHLSGEQIASYPMPFLSDNKQREVVCRLDGYESNVARLKSQISGQLRLIEERKRSLITAAVTGEFDVTTASSRASDVAMSRVGGVG